MHPVDALIFIGCLVIVIAFVKEVYEMNRGSNSTDILREDDKEDYERLKLKCQQDCRKAHSPYGVSRMMKPSYEHPYYKKHIEPKNVAFRNSRKLINYYTENEYSFEKVNGEIPYMKACIISAEGQAYTNVRPSEYKEMGERFDKQREHFPQFADIINETEQKCMEKLIKMTKGVRKAVAVPAAFRLTDSSGQLLKASEFDLDTFGFYLWSNNGAIDSKKIESRLNDIQNFIGVSGGRLYLHLKDGKGYISVNKTLDSGDAIPNKINFDKKMLKTGSIFFGVSNAGSSVYCDLEKLSHLLLVGMSGSGKSVFQNVFIASLYQNINFIEKIYLCDLKGGVEFFPYNGCPKTTVVCDMEELKTAVYEVERVMRSRLEEMKQKGDRTYNGDFIILQIDEFTQIKNCQQLLGKDEYKTLDTKLKTLAALGRAAKIRLVAGLQKCTTAEMDSGFKGNLQSVALMKVKDGLTVSNTLGDSEELKELEIKPTQFGKGRMALALDSEDKIHEVQCPFLSDEACRAMIEEYKKQI